MTSFRFVVQGRQCATFDDPKTTTHGAPTAAAMCAMPLSLPTNTWARDARAATSGKVRFEKPITGDEDSLINSSSNGRSFGDVIATGVSPRLVTSLTTRAKFSSGQRFVSSAAAG